MNFKTTDMLSFISYKVNNLDITRSTYFFDKRNLEREYDFWDSFDSYLRDGNGETYIKDEQ